MMTKKATYTIHYLQGGEEGWHTDSKGRCEYSTITGAMEGVKSFFAESPFEDEEEGEQTDVIIRRTVRDD